MSDDVTTADTTSPDVGGRAGCRSPGRVFDRWITGLALIALLVGAVVALRRTTQREYPAITSQEVFAGTDGSSGSAEPIES